MSKIERGSFELFKTSFTGKTENTLVDLAKKLEKTAVDQESVSITLAKDGLRIDMDSAAFFESASAVLNESQMQPLLPVLREVRKTKYNIDIEGHTDDRNYYHVRGKEIDTNWSLSGARASSVAHYLFKIGFREKRIRIVGYASNRPKVIPYGKRGDSLKNARAKNRRVSLLIR